MNKEIISKFIADVEAMRISQTKYFKSRTNLALKDAKDKEGKVDAQVALFKKAGLIGVSNSLEQSKMF